MLAAPRVVEIFRGFESTELEVLRPNWTADSAPELRDLVMLDVRRVIQSYDYQRCDVFFENWSGKLVGTLGNMRAFRNDIDASIHIFHDLYHRKDFIVSRALAHALRNADVRGLNCVDPASAEDAFFHEDLAAGLI